jgi:hypothetical protein
MRYLLVKSVVLTRTAAIAFCILALSACCSTKALLGVVIGNTPPLEQRVPGHLVVVCPSEKVTLGWGVSSDVKTATLTDVSPVSLPNGLATLQAGTASKDYTLSAKGDCDARDTAKVIVASPNTPFVFSTQAVGSLENGTLKWEAVLPETFYSSKVKITSLKLNAPPTISGWIVNKVDLNGFIHNFPITNASTTPWSSPVQLAGTWQLIPKDPAGELNPRSLPSLVEIQVTLTCE